VSEGHPPRKLDFRSNERSEHREEQKYEKGSSEARPGGSGGHPQESSTVLPTSEASIKKYRNTTARAKPDQGGLGVTPQGSSTFLPTSEASIKKLGWKSSFPGGYPLRPPGSLRSGLRMPLYSSARLRMISSVRQLTFTPMHILSNL
jgi:hypothetical protein